MLKNLEVLWLTGMVVNGQEVSHGAGTSSPRLVRDLVIWEWRGGHLGFSLECSRNPHEV